MRRRDCLSAFGGAITATLLAACGGGGGGGDDGGGSGVLPPSELTPDRPSNIAGLGQAGGSPATRPFNYPAGISARSPYSTIAHTLQDQSDALIRFPDLYERDRNLGSVQTSTLNAKGAAHAVGRADLSLGAGAAVILRIPLTNSTDAPTVVVFPAGLIAEHVDDFFQPGVLLAEVRVTVPARSTLTIALQMHCGDARRIAPRDDALYEIKGVSTSATLNQLIQLLRGRKINYEHYSPPGSRDWWYISHRLRLVVYTITNGNGLLQMDIDWIATLPYL